MEIKNVLIFGDSYSTFEGYVPQGFDCFYPEECPERTDVCEVTQTWWHQVLTQLNANLVQNNSWSGATICHTGYEGMDCSAYNSFIYRLENLIKENFFSRNQIDTVFLFGGTNDSWANAPLGELQYADWEKDDLYKILPAICYFLKTLKDQLSQAQIICLLNPDMKEEITAGFETACRYYGVRSLRLEQVDKDFGHPTIKGMAQFSQQILQALK